MTATTRSQDRTTHQKNSPIFIPSLKKIMYFHSRDNDITWVKQHPFDDVAVPVRI